MLRTLIEQPKPARWPALGGIGGARRVQLIAVVQQKGGVGKSTIAVNLACELALAGKSTLLIDVDPLGSASRYLGGSSRDARTVADVVLGRAGISVLDKREGSLADDIEAAVDRIFDSGPPPSAARPVEDVERLFVVPSSRGLSKMERSLTQVGWLKEAVQEALAEGIEVVILDTPPRWDMLTISALVAVRTVMAPTELSPLSLMALSRLTEGLTAVQRRVNPHLDPIPWIVPSRVRHTRLSRRCLIDLQETYPGRVLPMIRESARVAEAPGFHLPVTRFAPRSIGAQDFAALTQATIERVFRKRHRRMTLSV